MLQTILKSSNVTSYGGGLGKEFKYHPLCWSRVCSPLSEGRREIQNLLVFNCALLGKWLWCHMHNRGLVQSSNELSIWQFVEWVAFYCAFWSVWGYGVGGNFHVTPDLGCGDVRLDYGMTSGVGMWPLRKSFQIYLLLPLKMMLLLWLTWNFIVVPISET